MIAYYNEIDPYAADWLRNLIAAGHIAPGDVDTRSIENVCPDDLRTYTQCHFFAGIGVWSYALRLSGWDDSRPVWTGSCPCQPFSMAGKGNGFADKRHLWPAWFWLIEQCRPAILFGEQAEGAASRVWLDLVSDDLEACGYAVGAAVFPAAGVAAPHARRRSYFVAHPNDSEWRAAQSAGHQRDRQAAERDESHRDAWQRLHGPDWRGYAASFLSDVHGTAARMGRLRAYGNAVVSEAARAFIESAV